MSIGNEDLQRHKALWGAVLLQGIKDAARGHRYVSSGKPRNADGTELDALRWIKSDQNKPGSFVFCCEVLGYSAEYVRDAWRRNLSRLGGVPKSL